MKTPQNERETIY